jgi:hypothetical protein
MRVFVAALIAVASVAHAEPWLCMEENGVKRFNYDPASAARKECVDHPIPSGNVWRANPDPGAGRDADFPRVDARTQNERDAARREILERELAQERRALDESRRELAEQLALRAREKGRAREAGTLKPYEDRIRVHTSNISNLKKELGREG